MERYHPYISGKQKAKVMCGILLCIIGLTAFAALEFGRGVFYLAPANFCLAMDMAMFALFGVGMLVINIPESKKDVETQIASGVRAAKAAKMKHIFGLSAAGGCACTAALYKDHLSVFCEGKEILYPLHQIEECVYFERNEYEVKCSGFSENVRRQIAQISAEKSLEAYNLLLRVNTAAGEKVILLTSKKNVYLLDKLLKGFRKEQYNAHA